MAHNRKYVPGGVSLVQGRLRNSIKIMEHDLIEQFLIESHFLDHAPFKWVGLMYRYGLRNLLIPEYDRIDKKDGELPIAIELKMNILEWADKNNLKLLYDIFMIGALEALLHVGNKYNLPIERLEIERAKYGTIPETIEECEAYPKE